jgi:spore maturation protein CgeB
MPGFYLPPDMATRDDRMAMALMYLGPKITSMERTRLLKALGERYPVDIYTNSDTSMLPLSNHGAVKTHSEMPLVFATSDINLNMTAKSIRSGIPLRVFDVLGCGGFLLTNYQPEFADYFTIGEDFDIYTSEEDLLEKVEYYLSHEKERKEIAANGQNTVRQCHTFHQRMAEMIDIAFSF